MFALLTLLSITGSFPLAARGRNFGEPSWPNYDDRIINGTRTTIEENPHQVSVQIENSGHRCGGSIISKNWAITVAHCVLIKYAEYIVLSGTASLSRGGNVNPVSEIIIHENFHFNDFDEPKHDVALLRVASPFEFGPRRMSIPMFGPNEETPVGSMAVITGWGYTTEGLPDILQMVRIPIISREKCNDLLEGHGGVGKGEICAAYEDGGKDACSGDSGGPLSVNGRLAGMVSWGEGCALPGQPGVYTEIAHYRHWIEKNSGV